MATVCFAVEDLIHLSRLISLMDADVEHRSEPAAGGGRKVRLPSSNVARDIAIRANRRQVSAAEVKLTLDVRITKD